MMVRMASIGRHARNGLRGIKQIVAATDDEWTRNALRFLLEQAEDHKLVSDEAER